MQNKSAQYPLFLLIGDFHLIPPEGHKPHGPDDTCEQYIESVT